MIQVCLNGKRSKAEHPALPVTAVELLYEAQDALKAGGQTIHFHVRDGQGKETFAPNALAIQVGQLKEALPGVLIGISTGAWVEPSVEKRLALINSWEVLPDYVSINGHEDGFERIFEAIRKKGIDVEAGLQNAEAARHYLAAGFLKDCFRVLIEPAEQELAEALATVSAIESVVGGQMSKDRILLHGLDQTCWPVLYEAIERGYQVRIGLEDTLYDRTGRTATGNAALVTAAKVSFPGS